MSKMVLKIIDALHPVRCVIVLFCVMQDLICRYGTNMKKNEMNSPINMYMGTSEYIMQYISPVAAIATDGYRHAMHRGMDS